MDFMKVIDQTVREIKREVNLKVLKVPEIEQKVLDATDDEPWGPHGTVLAEIAQATKKFSECQMVMGVLWTRLSETGRNWRYVYKSLTVIEYLVANGSERAVDDIIEHTFQISALSSFEYVEPNGKDVGLNVRKKVETIVSLLNNKDKIQEVRNKAAATRDKYFGLSSTGITYKSGSASLSSSSSRTGDRYGGFGNTRDDDSFSDSYKDRDRFGEDKFEKSTNKSRRGVTGNNQDTILKKGSSHHGRGQGTSAASKPVIKISDSNMHASTPSQSSNVPSNNYEDTFDDFDPRGTSSSRPAAGNSQVDMFGQSPVGDLLDVSDPLPTEDRKVNSTSSGVDLFADATFVSAPSNVEEGTNVDLFASKPASSSATSPTIDFFAAPDPVTAKAVDPFAPQPTSSPAISSTTDFFAAPDPVATKVDDSFASKPESKSSEFVQATTKAVDPFAAVPLNSFDGSDLFGAFNSHTDALPKGPSQNSVDDSSHNNLNGKPQTESMTPSKGAFQVKSGIWADSLSRGLIDLNISAPKKVNLADVGIVGGLTETDEITKALPTSYYMGRAMGTGSGLGISDSTSTAAAGDDIFSNFTSPQYQFGGFQK